MNKSDILLHSIDSFYQDSTNRDSLNQILTTNPVVYLSETSSGS